MPNYNAIPCVNDGKIYVVDNNGNSLLPGEIWVVNQGTDATNICVTIDSINTVDTPSYLAQTQYTDCSDCLEINNVNVVLQSCRTITKYSIPITEFTLPLSVNDAFFMSFSDRGRVTEECVYVIGTTLTSPTTYDTLSLTSYLNCLGCSISSNTTTFLVEQCSTGIQYYVLLPVNVTIGNFISFNPNNTLDQLCGEIIQEEPGTPPTAIFLSDFRACEDCLTQVSVTRELISCIDNTIEIVFASVLYNLNESSFLTINDPNEGFSGCYRIGNISTDPVTVTGYLSYSPSPSCEECISCNGFEFEYGLCSDENITGSTYSNQFIEVGQSFLHPLSGCCEVTNVITANTSPTQFYSFYEYETCEFCTGDTTTYESWVGTDCLDSSQYIVTVPSGYTTGNTFAGVSGVITNKCIQLTELYIDQPITTFIKTNEVLYTDCPSCKNSTKVAYPFVNCLTNEVTYFSISLTNYELLLENGFIRDGSYTCYYGLNGCATATYTEINGTFFTNCEECTAPLSAGTEVSICVLCPTESGSTVTSVTAPHPQWTNAQGKTVILLDAIVLGGPNGLNN
jgi:hypothetical protein